MLQRHAVGPFLVLPIALFSGASSPPSLGAAQDGIVINEVHYHPASECEEEEFIELFNRGPATVDLGGWSFVEGVPFKFPAGTTMDPGEYLVVARDPAALEARYGTIGRLHGPWGAWPGSDHPASLSNDGEDIVLADGSGAVACRVEYDDKTPWPVAPDGGGPSLELVCPDLPAGTAGNWRAADAPGSRWISFQASGRAFGPSFLLRLTGPGVWYVDDVQFRLEAGGPNLLGNGGFEEDGGWSFEGSHGSSAIVASGAHGGGRCLRIVASAAGGPGNAVGQTVPGLSLGETRYTVSFWARRVQEGTGLVAGIAGDEVALDVGEGIPMGGKEEGWSYHDAASGKLVVVGMSLEPVAQEHMYFLHGTLSGDGGIEAEVEWLEAASGGAQAGLMLREDTAEDSKFAMVSLGFSQGVSMGFRAAAGGATESIQGTTRNGPVGLRLERKGSTFLASADTGGGFVEIGRADIPMTTSLLVGLVVAPDSPAPAMATFEGVRAGIFPLEAAVAAEGPPLVVATPGAPNIRRAPRTPPSIRKVTHLPAVPDSGDGVTIRAKVDCIDGTPVTSVSVEYQIVPPGRYIRIYDGAYETDWTPVAMGDDGSGGDEEAGDGVWTAVLPARPHRTLVRYRIAAEDAEGGSERLPYPDDPTPNFAWFVDDGIPDWVADRHSYLGPVPHAHPSGGLSALPVYRLLADAADFDACYYGPDRSTPSGSEWRGTLVSSGTAYDHVRYRLRGGATRSLEKRGFKVKLNRGSRLERLDDFGGTDGVKRTDLNLNAVFQLAGGNPEMPAPRGECGLYDALAYSLCRWMGVPSPATDWVHFRVVRGEDEAGGDQYSGDFFGLYQDVENPDSRFLESHGLPQGNLYKMEGSWSKEANGCDPADDADIRELAEKIPGKGDPSPGNDAWVRDHIDLEGYLSYHAVLQMTAMQDIGSHNFLLYRHPRNGRWMMLPWDVHLSFTWGSPEQTAQEDWWQALIFSGQPDHQVAEANRLREGLDLLFHEEKLFPIIDGWAAMIGPLAAADRDRWGDGSLEPPYGALDAKVADLKDWIHDHLPTLRHLCADDTVPSTPAILSPSPGAILEASSLRFVSTAFAGSAGRTPAAARWIATRLARSGGAAPDLESLIGENELRPDWDSGPLAGGGTTATIPAGALAAEAGAIYRVRVRHLDVGGRWSHWSAPVDVGIVPASPAALIRGDADGNGTVDISDPIATLGHLFLGGGDLRCPKAGDANDDGRINLTDPIFALTHLYLGGAHPPDPYPSCGGDPTADDLPCPSSACR